MKTTGIVILIIGCLSTLGGILAKNAGHQQSGGAGWLFIVLGAILISRANKKRNKKNEGIK